MHDFMTVEEAAAKWSATVQRVRALCRAGEVAGAVKRGKMWFIPSQSEHPAQGRKRRYQFDGTKQKIFEASVRLFAERSFEAVLLKDIADSTGIVQSAIYRHFRSKREILEAAYGYFAYHYIADRPNMDELASYLTGESLAAILESGYYGFALAHQGNLLAECLKIVLQRMSVDERAGELYRTYILESGFTFAKEFYEKAAADGRLPTGDPLALSLFSNMARLTNLLSWLANVAPKEQEKLIRCQKKLREMLIRASLSE